MPTQSPFSLLLPVWDGDRVEHLEHAFRSAVVDQSLRPDEVVIVQDGPVSQPLADCLATLCRTSPVPVNLVRLEANVGLGPALNAGLDACRFEIVARMDADDVAMQHRFAAQIPMMAEADVVGAGLLEFDSATGEVVGRRVPPTGNDIARYARIHDPFNHPTVVYRRSAVLAAGGYADLPLMEDYWLFARMLAGGARAANLVEPLVSYRVSPDAYKRRGGRQLLRSELRLQQRLLADGFIGRGQFARNVLLRGGYRLIPWQVRRAIYRTGVAAYRRRLREPEFVSPVLATPTSALDRANDAADRGPVLP